MFNNKFWSKRKSVIDKNKANVGSEEFREINKDKKAKKSDKNGTLFYKLKKSFVKAKSMDNADVIERDDRLHKFSCDNLAEPIKVQKNNGRSLRRIFSSNKQKADPIVSITETKEVDKIESIPLNKVTSWDKCNVPSTKVPLRQRSPLPGIINHGNTCYINSVIQCLNSIDALVQYFVLDQFKSIITEIPVSVTDQSLQIKAKSKDNFSLLLSLSSLLKSLWQKDLNCNILSNDFKMKLAATERSFRSNDQQDAQEFLLYLLNYCHEILKLPSTDNRDYNQSYIRYKEGKYNLSSEAENISQQNRSIIHKLFVTHQQLTITCPGCNSKQYKLEPHLCLSLPVPAKTMEPLYYCFIEKDGSQICAAMWINTISLVQYVRANIAHKFRIDICRVIIMLINEAGFGKYFQDSEQAVDLLLSDNTSQNVSNLWNGIVALEIPSVMYNSSCRDYDYFDTKIYQKSVRPVKGTTSPIRRTNSSNVSGITRNYDNFNFEEQNAYDSQSSKEDFNSQSHLRYDNDEYQQSNVIYSNNSSNDTPAATDLIINLVIIHVEEIFEKTYISSWRRFSAPVSLLVRKEIEFKDLEKMVISQLEGVYHCNIQSKLKSHLRFLVWDGLSNIDADITSDHQFPLLTEAVESIVSWLDDTNIIRMVCVWSPINGARLMQTVFANLRLSHSLGREVSKLDFYSGGSNSQSLSLMDAWSSIEENGSVELVMRATLSKRSQLSDSRNISLEDCLKAYVSEEILDAKDAWKCPNCRKFQRATISNSIYSLPDILVLHLKRFQSYSLSFNCDGKSCRNHEDIALTTVGGNNSHSHNGSLLFENNSNNKLNILVDYPLSGLDMKSYLSADTITKSPKKFDSSEYYYDLIAVCNHQGTLSTGHYTAFCRSSVDYKWRLFNDDVVREVLADKVIQPNAYILFYQRRSSIKCFDQHWSAFLNPIKSEDYTKATSPKSLKTAPTLDTRKYGNFNKISEMKQMQRKSDPPIRRTPCQNKRLPDYQFNDSNINFQPLSLPRLLTSDDNNNSIRVNNTPIVDEDDNDGTTSQGSTSYDEYIPSTVNKKLLTLQMKAHDNNLPLNSSKSHISLFGYHSAQYRP